MDATGTIDDLPSPFHAHLDGVDIEDKVDVFNCVIGQDGQLIRTEDYVKLSSEHYEVACRVYLCGRVFDVLREVMVYVCVLREAVVWHCFTLYLAARMMGRAG